MEISFAEYSRKYDMLLQYSPPYQEIGELLMKELEGKFSFEAPLRILDVGGGTGNFSKLLLSTFPNAKLTFLEPSSEMMEIAKGKLYNYKVDFLNNVFEEFQIAKKFDLIICIHALYLMPMSIKLVPKFREMMHHNSILMVCDIGQEIKVYDWYLHIAWENLKRHGLLKTIQLLRSSAEIKSANLDIQKKQQSGEIWKHSLSEFRSYFSQYYDVLTGFSCYRGCSNFLTCKVSII